MKTSLIVLSLALSATALFAQNTAAPAAPYSNISQYPAPAATAPLADKTIQLDFKKLDGFLAWQVEQVGQLPFMLGAGQFPLILVGQQSVTLKKGQNLILTVQNPNTSIGPVAIPGTYMSLPKKIKYYDTHTRVTNPSHGYLGAGLVTGGESHDIQIVGNEPIVYSFQAVEAGTQLITVFVDAKGIVFEPDSVFDPLSKTWSAVEMLQSFTAEITVTVK